MKEEIIRVEIADRSRKFIFDERKITELECFRILLQCTKKKNRIEEQIERQREHSSMKIEVNDLED